MASSKMLLMKTKSEVNIVSWQMSIGWKYFIFKMILFTFTSSNSLCVFLNISSCIPLYCLVYVIYEQTIQKTVCLFGLIMWWFWPIEVIQVVWCYISSFVFKAFLNSCQYVLILVADWIGFCEYDWKGWLQIALILDF